MKLRILACAAVLIAGAYSAAAQEIILDVESGYSMLQEAVAKKDIEQVKKLAAATSAMARKIEEEPAPTAADEKEAYASRIKRASEIQLYTEYALFATATEAEPAAAIDLLTTLEQQNPKSTYLEYGGYARYFALLRQTNQAAKIVPLAEKALASLPESTDLLATLADAAMAGKQGDRAIGYANRLVSAAAKSKKPDSLPQADFDRQKGAALGRGYWIAGVLYGERNQAFETDRNLRAALPYIRGNDAMMAPALFYLGVANYTLGRQTLNKARVLEAAKFSEQAAAIKSAYAQQAWRNAQGMKDEAAKMR